MKLLKQQKPSLRSLLEDIRPISDDPAWVYGDKLFNEYLAKNNPSLKEWMTRRDVKCVACRREEVENGPDAMNLGCDSCWRNECEMMELSDKFYKQAQELVHLLSKEEIAAMKREYINAENLE